VLRDSSLIPLSHQHHNGLALSVMTRRSLAQDASEENLRALGKRVVDRYEIELTNHFRIEEETVFPAAAACSLVEGLIGDHREMERLVENIRRTPTPVLLEEFCALITRHIRTEENELFEWMQRELPRETLDRLGQVIDAQAVRICL
jgi:hemerythrin-like domain-containing protein